MLVLDATLKASHKQSHKLHALWMLVAKDSDVAVERLFLQFLDPFFVLFSGLWIVNGFRRDVFLKFFTCLAQLDWFIIDNLTVDFTDCWDLILVTKTIQKLNALVQSFLDCAGCGNIFQNV
jgi:hypothetical protein